MLIDLEALFHPRPDGTTPTRADEIADAALGYSALRVGLLPLRLWVTAEDPGVDVSGLGSIAGKLIPHGVPHWERADTDEMHMVRKRKEMAGANNCLSFSSRPD